MLAATLHNTCTSCCFETKYILFNIFKNLPKQKFGDKKSKESFGPKKCKKCINRTKKYTMTYAHRQIYHLLLVFYIEQTSNFLTK